MKIGVMSDLHLGYKQYGLADREKDFYNQLQKCCDELNKNNCDIVIIGGDIFDKPNPSPEAIHKYLDIIGDLNSDVILTIKGNHTMLLRDTHYAVDNLVADDSGFEGYFLLEDSTWESNTFALSGGDMQFSKWKDTNIVVDGITYRSNVNLQDFLETQKKMASNVYDKNTFRILVIHQSFKEFCGFLNEELSIKDIDYDPYDVIICGHIHSRAEVRINKKTFFLQPGSIERMNIAEARDEEENGKGIYIIDTNKETIDFHQVSCDRKFFYDDVEFKDLEEVREFFSDLQKEIDKEEYSPIIAYDFMDDCNGIVQIRDGLSDLSNILVSNSKINIKDDEYISEELTENEIPSIVDAIRMYGKKYISEEHLQLAIDMYKHPNDMQSLVDDYINKQ